MSTHAGEPEEGTITIAPSHRTGWLSLALFPWWTIPILIAGIAVVVLVRTDAQYSTIWSQLQNGIGTTLRVSFIAFALSMLIGLLIGLIRSNPPTAKSGFFRVLFYNLATLYVEVLRGLPILVVILVIAFAIVPELVKFLNSIGMDVTVRDIPFDWRAIIALTLTYAAFLSEVFRGGIQSVSKGQIEAAKSLGMTYIQIMRFVVLPQAIRRILPPLGNDLIAMVKDSSLVAILGVQDIAQLAKLTSSSTFRYLETYLIAAMIYLSMTLLGSLLVRWLERIFRTD